MSLILKHQFLLVVKQGVDHSLDLGVGAQVGPDVQIVVQPLPAKLNPIKLQLIPLVFLTASQLEPLTERKLAKLWSSHQRSRQVRLHLCLVFDLGTAEGSQLVHGVGESLR